MTARKSTITVLLGVLVGSAIGIALGMGTNYAKQFIDKSTHNRNQHRLEESKRAIEVWLASIQEHERDTGCVVPCSMKVPPNTPFKFDRPITDGLKPYTKGLPPKFLDANGNAVDAWGRPFWGQYVHDLVHRSGTWVGWDVENNDPFNPGKTINQRIIIWSTGGKYPDVTNWR
jgi:hypothetical protein